MMAKACENSTNEYGCHPNKVDFSCQSVSRTPLYTKDCC